MSFVFGRAKWEVKYYYNMQVGNAVQKKGEENSLALYEKN